MTDQKDRRTSALTRRHVVKGAAAIGGTTLMPGVASRAALAATAREKTLIIAAPATPQSLDLEFDFSLGTIDAIGALYDNLLQYEKIPDRTDPSVLREDVAVHADKPFGLNLKGKLAEKWEVAADGKSSRFQLKQGVKSNWGNEFTAEDVKWTWERKLGLRGLGAFQTSVLGVNEPDQIKADGKYTVSFHVPKPSPLLLKQLVNFANPIYDSTKLKEVATKDDPWARKFLDNNSAGFGPYVLERIVRGQQAVFTARKDYWGGLPFMESVIMREVPASASRVSLLQGGAVDIAQFLQPLEYITAGKASGVAVDSVESSYILWVELNAKVAPFDNVKVRQAMNLAFPRQEVLKTIFRNLADKQTGIIPKFYPMFTDQYWQYDTDAAKAKQLLAEAGYQNGFSTVLSYNAGDPVQEPIAILYQTALRDIGVDLTLKKLPAGTFFDFLSKRTEAMIFFLDAPWVPDPGYDTHLYFKSDSFVDFSNYANQEVDTLIEKGLEVTDDKERQQIYARVQQIVLTEAPWVFMVFPQYTLARRADLKGFTYYTSNNLRFQDFTRGT
jgi:peptide/nickel transport system substrate-binding protein